MKPASNAAGVGKPPLAAKVVGSRVVARLRRVWVPLAVIVGLAAFLLPVARQRLIDGDEGYLLVAARLMAEGELPYRDFFLPQGPVVPAVFGAAFSIVGRSWQSSRTLAGILAVVMGWLVYRETLAVTRRRAAAVFATLLYAFSGLTIGWLTIVKGFGMAALWLLVGVWLVGAAVRRPRAFCHHRTWAAAGAGVALGLAASTRGYAIVVMPVLALYLLRESGRSRASVRRLGAYALGSVVGLLPLLASLAMAHEAFLFDTILFHGVREYGQDSFFGSAAAKLPLILKSLGLKQRASIEDRQLLGMLLLATTAILLRARVRRGAGSAAAWVWPALFVASLLPNPFHPQYFSLLVPFLAIGGGQLFAVLLDGWQRWWPRLFRVAVPAAAFAYVVYQVTIGWLERDCFLHSAKRVPGVMELERVPRWRIETVEAVAEEIDRFGLPVGASWWPGYFVSSRTSITRALANDFGFRAAAVLFPEKRRRLHVASHQDLGDMIRRGQPRLFVEGNWADPADVSQLPQQGYRHRASVSDVRIWVRDY